MGCRKYRIGVFFDGTEGISIHSWMVSLSPIFPIAALISTFNRTTIKSTGRLVLEKPESQTHAPRVNRNAFNKFIDDTVFLKYTPPLL